jgi:hypothetical protein
LEKERPINGQGRQVASSRVGVYLLWQVEQQQQWIRFIYSQSSEFSTEKEQEQNDDGRKNKTTRSRTSLFVTVRE